MFLGPFFRLRVLVIFVTVSTYLPDTNIWKFVGRDTAITRKFEKALGNGAAFVIGPPVLIELVRGMVRGGPDMFSGDKLTFSWMKVRRCEVLKLPRPFMVALLHTSSANSGVTPEHYRCLIDMIVRSADFEEFVRHSEEPGSVWRDISRLDSIHEGQLEQELRALESIAARRGGPDLAKKLAETFGMPGCRPNYLLLREKFSAAIEYLESSVAKVRYGAKPRKNDRGLYVDFQMLLYLGWRDLNFLTNENFASEIKRSPQKARIVGLDTLP